MTETAHLVGTSPVRATEGESTTMTTTATSAANIPLADLDDAGLVAATRDAWVAGLTANAFDGIRDCQAEALRRGKPHLYDEGYIAFWVVLPSPSGEAT